MDKIEFINTILEMYPNSFTEHNTGMWIDLYTRKLPSNIDFQELLDDMLVSYQNTTTAPSAAFLVNLAAEQQKRIKAEKQHSFMQKKLTQWQKEREEIEKNDKPVTCEVLTPLEVIKKNYGDFKREDSNYFTKEEMSTFRQYVNTVIPTEKLKIKFWQQVCNLISGGNLSELCRNM